MYSTLVQCCCFRHCIALGTCLIWLVNIDTGVKAQDVVSSDESQPPAFFNNDRFHNITVKARISDRFEI
jgi:hypothetical protein